MAVARGRTAEPTSTHERLVALARYIEVNAGQKLPLSSLAARSGLSPTYVQRKFKAVFGVSPKVYQDAARLKLLKQGLRAGADVTGAIFDAGYGSTSRVYGKALRHVGMTPNAYRAGGAGETISYGCRSTAIGLLMMAATDRGVCFAMFGDDARELKAQLEAEFSNAVLSVSPNSHRPELDDWMTALDAHLSGVADRPELPLDMRGTAFQIQTWTFLLSIGEGEVVSYGELAAGIGRPKAFRAAASACAKNRLAVLVPCHRVLRGNGGVGGYRWGVDRKRALLEMERLGNR